MSNLNHHMTQNLFREIPQDNESPELCKKELEHTPLENLAVSKKELFPSLQPYSKDDKSVSEVYTNIRTSLRGWVFWFFLLFLLFYFTYHLIQGEQGLVALSQYEQQILDEMVKLTELTREFEWWQKRVGWLQEPAIQPDLLSELLKDKQGLLQKGELVYFLK